jgi:hypothetical protein
MSATIQVMPQLGEGNEFSLAHLSFGLLDQSALFGGEDIIRINRTFGLDEHAVLLAGERHEVPLLEVKGFEHQPRNNHLSPLAHASGTPWCGG